MEGDAMFYWSLLVLVILFHVEQDLLILHVHVLFIAMTLCYVWHAWVAATPNATLTWHSLPILSIPSYRCLKWKAVCISVSMAYTLTYETKHPERPLAHADLWWAMNPFAQCLRYINYMDSLSLIHFPSHFVCHLISLCMFVQYVQLSSDVTTEPN